MYCLEVRVGGEVRSFGEVLFIPVWIGGSRGTSGSFGDQPFVTSLPSAGPVNDGTVQDICTTPSSSALNLNVEPSREDSQAAINENLDIPSASSSVPRCDDTARQSAGAVSKPSFRLQLASCFVDINLTHTQGNKILGLLRTHSCLGDLPKDVRTLVSTPRTKVITSVVEPGEYVHFGVESKLSSYLCNICETIPNPIQLDFHIDGCTLDASHKIQLWPIQIRISNIKNSKPIIVGIYKGPQKPTNPEEYLEKFVSDIESIMSNGGILLEGKRIAVSLRCFIADAPARAFALNHHYHTSHHPCSKCHVTGKTVEGRAVFHAIDSPLRTDEEYARRSAEDEHFCTNSTNPLASLPMGMVSQVPFEYMHLCLGVVKKLLSVWVCGKFCPEAKLSATQLKVTTARINVITKYCPSDFARRPTPITNFSGFKATEFRQFLLYTGPVVMHGILDPLVYNHFLLLHSATRILVSPSLLEKHIAFAKTALKFFVCLCVKYYGTFFNSYNVHGLLHLADVVERFGNLDSFSAFPFENLMQIFQIFWQKPNQPLQQIANRMAEFEQHGSRKEGCNSATPISASMPFRDSSGACANLSTDTVPVSLENVRAKCYRMPLSSENYDSALGTSQWVVIVFAHAEEQCPVYARTRWERAAGHKLGDEDDAPTTNA
ncbi:uncharacterized protein LOC143213636, partial [Lasioglossum baleicum]|uniref:uncharacterized protein LOC143213636 n=1 Tax=Lasioglossum baleicum TaxID=434251 RepID=UPI003FCD096A